MSQNTHIRDYLSHYLSFTEKPGFAVLIRGPWGIGKTFIVDRLLNELLKSNEKRIYISMYGLKSIEDIDAALFQAVVPALGWKGTKLAGRVAKAALKFVNFELEVGAEDVLDKFDAKVYVFDDIERCDLSVDAILGYINEFVEHNGCRVIVIANEAEIEETKGYRRRREKLIGKTLEVEPEFDAAFSHFVLEMTDAEVASFYQAHRNAIESVFAQSRTSNFRLLRQGLWEFSRVLGALSPEVRSNDAAMLHLLRFFFAWSFELSSGGLKPRDLLARKKVEIVLAIDDEKKGKRVGMRLATKKYPDVSLTDDVLSDEVMVDIFARGVVDAAAIHASVTASRHFRTPGLEPPWRTVAWAVERSDEEFGQALEELEKQFEKRELLQPGAILHMFGNQIELAKSGLRKRTTKRVVREAKQYIDDLLSAGRLEPSPLYAYQDDLRHGGWGGSTFSAADTPEFGELFAYLKEKRKIAREASYGDLAKTLLGEMLNDPSLFIRRVCVSNSEDSIYTHVPLLSALDPEQFLDALWTLYPEDRHSVFNALRERYDRGSIRQELLPELPWIRKVRSVLIARSKKMAGVAKWRTKKWIEWYLDCIAPPKTEVQPV